MSAQNRKSCNTAIRSVCHTPEPLRRRNGLRCAALFLRLRTVPRSGLRPRAGWLRLRAGAPTRRAAFGSRAARAAGPPAGGFAPFFLRGGERRTTPKICRLTKAARCAILHLDDRRKFALRRPEIGAYAEISRAFRCVYRVFTTNGAQISGCHAFCTEFCRCFRPVSARTRILPTRPRVSPELRAAHRGGDRRPRIRCGGAPSCTKSRDYPTNGSILRHDFSVRKLYNICRKEEQPWNLSKT